MFTWAETTFQDFRYALRTVIKRPGFSVAAVSTLKKDTGLNTAFFTILNTFVLRPMAVRDPYSLYQVGLRLTRTAEWGLSSEALTALRERTDIFSEVLASRELFTNLEGRVARGAIVTENYFSMLGGRIAIGRPIQSDDMEAVLVLSDRAWRQRFAADQGIVGQTVMMGQRRVVVIGVAAPEFEGLERMPDFWAPLEGWRRTVTAISSNLGVVGRLRKEMTVRRA